MYNYTVSHHLNLCLAHWVSSGCQAGLGVGSIPFSLMFEIPPPPSTTLHYLTPVASRIFRRQVTVMTHGGAKALRDDLDSAVGPELRASVQPLAEIVNEAPGNALALYSLGVLRYCGDGDLQKSVDTHGHIPEGVDGTYAAACMRPWD